MGYSINYHCQECNKKMNNILIGSGMLTHPRQKVPSYCFTCRNIVSVFLDKPICESCKSQVQIIGDFTCSHEFEESKPGQTAIQLSDSFLENNRLGVTRESLRNQLNHSNKILSFFRFTKKKQEYFYYVIDYSKKYQCPFCNKIELQMEQGDIRWD